MTIEADTTPVTFEVTHIDRVSRGRLMALATVRVEVAGGAGAPGPAGDPETGWLSCGGVAAGPPAGWNAVPSGDPAQRVGGGYRAGDRGPVETVTLTRPASLAADSQWWSEAVRSSRLPGLQACRSRAL